MHNLRRRVDISAFPLGLVPIKPSFKLVCVVVEKKLVGVSLLGAFIVLSPQDQPPLVDSNANANEDGGGSGLGDEFNEWEIGFHILSLFKENDDVPRLPHIHRPRGE